MLPDLADYSSETLKAVIYLLGMAISALISAIVWLAKLLVDCTRTTKDNNDVMAETIKALTRRIENDASDRNK